MTTFPLSLGAEDQGSDCLYVSRLTGKDSPQCGSFSVPCRTLPQALFLVNDGGEICLNGKDSESNPYECLKIRDGPNGTEFKTIEKSVSIQGVSSPAHISCGLVFASRSKYDSVKVSLSNLVFNNSRYGLVFFYVPSYDVVISDCKFMNCHKAIFLWRNGRSQGSSFISQKSSLEVTDSEFRNNTISIEFGPKFKNGSHKVSLSNLLFDNGTYGVFLVNVSSFDIVIAKCKFFNFSEAAVGLFWNEIKSVIREKSSLVATDNKFRYNAKSILVMLPNDFFEMTVSRCFFQNAKGRFHATNDHRSIKGAVFVRSQASSVITYPIHVLFSITDSIFQDLGHKDNSFAVSVRVDNLFGDGNISLFNTSFLNNENSVFAHGGFGLNLTHVTVTSTYGCAIMASAPPKTLIKAPGVRVFLEKCVLVDNRIGIRMSTTTCLTNTDAFCSTGDQTLVVKNSLILGGNETLSTGDAIKFRMSSPKQNDSRAVLKPSKEKVYLSPDFEAKLLLENVTFHGLHDYALSFSTEKNVRGLISVKNCRFLNNTQFVNRLYERGTIQIEFPNDDPPKCPRATKGNESKELVWDKKSELPVIIEDTLFENNVGISGALSFLNGNVTIKNCAFKNNEGVALGGHVYMKTGFGILNINNCSFLQKETSLIDHSRVSAVGCFLRSESAGPLKIQNSSFVADVNQEFDPIFAATKSNTIKIDSSTSFKCPDGKQIKLENIELVRGRETCWISVAHLKFLCEECPDGFYNLNRGSSSGLDIHKETKCLKCPYGATCENGDIKAQENFWGCYSSPLSTKLEFHPCPLEYCKPPTRPNTHAFNGCHGSRTGVLCGQCAEGLSEDLYSTSCREREKCHDHWFWIASLIYVIMLALYLVFKPPIFPWLYRQCLWFRKKYNSSQRQAAPHEANDEEHDAGYFKTIFYFYQVAEILMIKSPEAALHIVPFVTPVIALFNFQVRTINGSIGCPFPGLNVVTKELFLCLKFLATLLSIAMIYTIHRVISRFRHIPKPSLTLYLAVVLETLLLGYETLADTSLKLMHCVPVGLEWRLFIDGNIPCWQWWQYMQIVFILVFIIPLVLVLFWGSLMLSKDKLSAREFLTSCAFPLPFIFIWLYRYVFKKPSLHEFKLFWGNTYDAEEIKKVLHDPFRPPCGDDHGTLYWESVLTGRRFLLLTIGNFITDPLTRFICLDFACVVTLVHHLVSRPFRDRKANICEALSLMSLVAICTFNLAEVTLIAQGLEPTGPKENLFYALEWIEVALLGFLPAIACILVVLAALSQVIRVLYHCLRLLPRTVCLRSHF
ncbi:unnamed protein product [Pocillopora meandrina]|uniref:Right handed beta helix domain-containing protein n=1 Tax=Pocillopora meandrina TaxID=46732 RepID=A0AAU9WCK7_9CNID|nr:unnamed protein product [Pocillopora meandrina]